MKLLKILNEGRFSEESLLSLAFDCFIGTNLKRLSKIGSTTSNSPERNLLIVTLEALEYCQANNIKLADLVNPQEVITNIKQELGGK